MLNTVQKVSISPISYNFNPLERKLSSFASVTNRPIKINFRDDLVDKNSYISMKTVEDDDD